MGDELTDFARWLREVSARAGYDPDERGSTAKLARAAGIDPGQMSRFLNGKAAPGAQNMVHLAAALGVRVDEMAQRIAGTFADSPEPTGELPPEQWITRLGLKDPADRSLLLAMVDRMKLAQRERDEVQKASGRVAELAYRLAQEEVHSGDVPEVVSELHRLAEDLDLGEESTPPAR